jgi:triphosphoribosyl-dephospho-CoA synthase
LELDGIPVSASRVRNALSLGRLTEASALCPVSSRPYLLAALAQRALFVELDTPMKPGLVCPDSPGAHSDMDYTVMAAGIRALRPFWSQMALATDASQLISLGIEAENAMMAATGGVNTHRGAIFCLGLALNAAMRCFPDNGHFSQSVNSQQDMHFALCNIAGSILCNQLNVNDLTKTPLTGARAIAATGYRQLFEDWLPYYRDTLGLRPRYDNVIPSEASESHLKLLLRIMSTLDDTCVIKRVGVERAQQVKQEAREMADQVGHDGDSLIGGLCERYAAEGISPGGAADMLALTIFIHSILS